MSSSGYDVQQVCLNGHQITPSAETNPHLTRPRCPCCGEKTIMACPTCDAPIRGRCRVHGVVATRRISVPTHCHACGAAYPWRQGAIVAAIDALKTELAGRVPAEVIALIPLIGAETARTEVTVWLAWRCHQLSKPTPISWPAIHAQFGAGFKAIKHFKPSFLEALGAAAAAYPEARLSVSDAGVMLYPAQPPIARLTAVG